MSAHKKFQLKAQNWWLAVDPYMPPRRSGMHNNIPKINKKEKEMIGKEERDNDSKKEREGTKRILK